MQSTAKDKTNTRSSSKQEKTWQFESGNGTQKIVKGDEFNHKLYTIFNISHLFFVEII